MRCQRAFILVCGFVLIAVGRADPADPASAEVPPAGITLPVTRVVLFNSGVGYFEHFGTVSDSARVEFSLQVDDVQDVLKTLIVQDFDGGKITGVNYPSRDSLVDRLQVFSIDLTNPATLGELLLQLRGEQVSVATTKGPGHSAVVDGTIVGAEIRTRQIGDELLREEILTLLTAAGLQAVSLEEAEAIKLRNEKLNAELGQALSAIAQGRSAQQRAFTVHCDGQGKRRIRVGYVVSAPVWKSTYRLLLGEENKAQIQGWAIVDNTSQHDWRNVQLSLVSGTPISFRMPLYDPLYVDRPRINVAVAGQPNITIPERGQPAGLATGGGGSFGGGGSLGGAGGSSPFVTSGVPLLPFDPGQGVAALAAGEQVGEHFQYQLDDPVNVDRRKSATLPILKGEIRAEKISIYSEKTDATRPLYAARIKNTSDAYLMAGPVTVFDGATYAGEANIDNFPQDSERLVTYAVDLGLRVRHELNNEAAQQTVSLQRGNLKIESPHTRRHSYYVTNVEQASRSLIIEHPRPSREWQIIEPEKPTEDTENFVRYVYQAAVGETTFKVVETTTDVRQVALRDISIDEIRGFLAKAKVDENTRNDLHTFVQLHQQKTKLAMQLSTLNESISKIHFDQERIRKNMNAVDRTSEIYARYLKSFGEQEDQLLELQRQVQQKLGEIATTTSQMDELAPAITRQQDPLDGEDSSGGNGEDDPFGA